MAERISVPCGACTACCHNELLFLHLECGDDATSYLTRPAFNPITGKSGLALQHKADGSCIYLGPRGCTIHDRSPAICREFDCRRMYLKLKNAGHARHQLVDSAVLQAGKSRLRTLESRS